MARRDTPTTLRRADVACVFVLAGARRPRGDAVARSSARLDRAFAYSSIAWVSSSYSPRSRDNPRRAFGPTQIRRRGRLARRSDEDALHRARRCALRRGRARLDRPSARPRRRRRRARLLRDGRRPRGGALRGMARLRPAASPRRRRRRGCRAIRPRGANLRPRVLASPRARARAMCAMRRRVSPPRRRVERRGGPRGRPRRRRRRRRPRRAPPRARGREARFASARRPSDTRKTHARTRPAFRPRHHTTGRTTRVPRRVSRGTRRPGVFARAARDVRRGGRRRRRRRARAGRVRRPARVARRSSGRDRTTRGAPTTPRAPLERDSTRREATLRGWEARRR